jgi:dihydroneopterin aldolase
MNFNVIFKRMKFNLKRHYEDEKDETSYLTIALDIKVADDCINAKMLDQTFNYANLDSVVIDQIIDKKYELIENIAIEIRNILFKMKYVDGVNVSISKHDITDKISQVTMSYSFVNRDHRSHVYDIYSPH